MAIDIGRRQFISALGSATLAWPLATRAQQPSGKTRRIGLLQASLDDPVVGRGYPAFLDELKKSGFSENQNLAIEAVRIDQDAQKVFAETADLVRSNVAAWLGLVPKQMSTGDRTILGRITKRGNCYLRMLFIQGARAILLHPRSWAKHSFGPWLTAAAKRLHHNVLTVALANKLARIALTVLVEGRNYETRITPAAA